MREVYICPNSSGHEADQLTDIQLFQQGRTEPRTPCHGKEQMERQLSLRSEQVLRDRPESAGTAVLFLSGTEPADCGSTETNDRWTDLFTTMSNFHTHRLVEKHSESCSCNTPHQLT